MLPFLLWENCCSLACKFIMHKMLTEILIKYILKVLLFAHTDTHTHECRTSVCVCVCINNVCIFTWQTFYGLLLLQLCFQHFTENSIFLCSLPKFRVLFPTFSRFFSCIKPPTLCTQFLRVSVCVRV